MEALVLRDKKLEIKDVPEQEVNAGEARVKVLYAGLCGSDMHKIDSYDGDQPLILGHEFVGEVVEINCDNIRDGVNAKIGDVVAVSPTLPCNECGNCAEGEDNLCNSFHGIGRDRPGAFAENVNVPVSNLVRIPENSIYRNYVLADVVAVCLHAIDDIAGNVQGKKCLIIGDGAIGSVLAAMLKRNGAKDVSICGRHKQNHALLTSIADVNSINRREVGKYDYVFETVGRSQLDTIEQSIENVAVRGKIIALGVFPPGFPISFDNRSLFLKEASLTASVAYKKKYFAHAVEFLTNNPDFGKFITHEFKFADFPEGVSLMRNKGDESAVVKIIYRFDKQR